MVNKTIILKNYDIPINKFKIKSKYPWRWEGVKACQLSLPLKTWDLHFYISVCLGRDCVDYAIIDYHKTNILSLSGIYYIILISSDGQMIDYNRKLVGLDSWTDDQAQS